MPLLLAVSILWGLSFGLIKAEFSALSPATLATARIVIALPCFLPFLHRKALRSLETVLPLLGIGAIQYGLMYLMLFEAFRHLQGHEVALLTIFTPLYVILAESSLQRRTLPAAFWGCALLAVGGALWIFQPESWPRNGPGILLMQGSNACFALGQVAYRRIRAAKDTSPRQHYALLFAGALLPCLALLPTANPIAELAHLDASQWVALFYLGSVATGLGFFLWNAGAMRVSAPTLAVFNNLKIPLAALIALLVFKESGDYGRLLPGLGLMLAALFWAQKATRSTTHQP
jgi:drug/metabolite transporter (DMT)-like permease